MRFEINNRPRSYSYLSPVKVGNKQACGIFGNASSRKAGGRGVICRRAFNGAVNWHSALLVIATCLVPCEHVRSVTTRGNFRKTPGLRAAEVAGGGPCARGITTLKPWKVNASDFYPASRTNSMVL